MQQKDLYALQEGVLSRLQSMNDEQFGRAKLCGGTALSRCWLEHRVSYDLDFFLPNGPENGFNVMDLAVAIKQAGISFETRDLVQDDHKANQLHGDVLHEGKRLKVSFIEDAYFELYPSVLKPFGQLTVQTEEIPGLYHRKLRTMAGHGLGEEPDAFTGGRQKARDLFDLYVLSVKHMPLLDFIDNLPYPFPTGSFINGLVSMPWLELIDELEELISAPQWSQAKDVAFLRDSLYAQIGAETVPDDDETDLPGQAPS